MKTTGWHWMRRLEELLRTQRPEPHHHAERIVLVQLHIVMPAKVGVIAVVLYFLFPPAWFSDVETTRLVVQDTVKEYFVVYTICNALAAVVLALWRRFPAGLFQWLAFALGLLDGLFAAGLTVVTEGFDSIVYWVFPGLIVLNALSIPLAVPQIVLNLMLCFFYLGAGFLTASIPYELALLSVPGSGRSTQETQISTNQSEAHIATDNGTAEIPPERTRPPWWREDLEPEYDRDAEGLREPHLLRGSVLLLLTACCYGVQVLAERQRRVFEEEREFAVRDAQLRSAGRLAAEFTHQIKNPLAIINNAVFSIQRALNAGRTDIQRQVELIQEEVERSDRIVTQIMGYAQLTEGRVERLNVAEELDAAIERVFPPGVESAIRIERNYVRVFPPLLMQKRHLVDTLMNLLQNAREAIDGSGTVGVSAVCRPDYSIEISVQDTGGGIPPEKQERIFEAYYTTKDKGTGLGLSIVKHNVELYSGSVRVESELGKGTRFILTFPAKTVIGLEKQNATPF
jgi:nitrogen-specific signal transduction histidine kinase